MDPLPRVAVVGAGAVGCYFGGMLARAGCDVTLFGRPGVLGPHLQAIRRDGLFLDGVEIRETIPIGVGERVETVALADLVLFCVKTVDTERAARGIAPHLKPGSIVVSLQNGIDNVERMREAGIEGLPAVVFVAAAIEKPGVVKHRGRGDLVMGDSARRDEIERVAGWFAAVGVPCRVSNALDQELWLKLIINSMANATSALTHATYRDVAEDEAAWNVAIGIAEEAIAVAGKAGVPMVLDDVLDKGRAVMVSVGAATSSTEQDIAHGRPTEIGSLNGYIARKGAELGVATPINDAMQALVRLRERRKR